MKVADKKSKSRARLNPTEEAAAKAYVLEEQVGFLLRKVNQRASEIFQSVMSDFDVTPMQFAVLAKLDDIGPVSQNLLGRHVAMDPATIFGVVKRLAGRKLVHQFADGSDARLRLIELTDSGRDLVRRMKAIGTVVSQRTLDPLTQAEARSFLALLAKLE